MAIPFADVHPTDAHQSHPIEMLQVSDESDVAMGTGIRLPALQLALADYHRRFGGLVFRRASRG